MTIKETRGTVAGLVLLAAVSGGVAGSALHVSAPAARGNQQTAVYAAAAPQDNSCSGQSSTAGCPGPANTNWG
jgi:hypothetical protein